MFCIFIVGCEMGDDKSTVSQEEAVEGAGVDLRDTLEAQDIKYVRVFDTFNVDNIYEISDKNKICKLLSNLKKNVEVNSESLGSFPPVIVVDFYQAKDILVERHSVYQNRDGSPTISQKGIAILKEMRSHYFGAEIQDIKTDFWIKKPQTVKLFILP